MNRPEATESPDADRALVEAVLARVPRSFEELISRYQGLCWHIVLRMVRNPEDARDICQETFLRIFKYLHQYRFDSPLKSWVAQVAYSVAKRHLERKRIPIADEPDDPEAGSLLDSVSDGFDLEAANADDQINRLLHAAIDALPALQRSLLTMYHLDELSISEIASITGVPEGSVKSHLFRSRKRLRQWLELRTGVIT
ncbi:RNA polymerase sigma factor [Pinirhizobacter soli]|uniref:RNA polymerase sigma factor n=1 Tax=Pinirhizobacter soli TaxID=2786953 RepID=UPI00202A0073